MIVTEMVTTIKIGDPSPMKLGEMLDVVRVHFEKDSWAVRDGWGRCLSKSGEWIWEPMPSSRTDAFLAKTRFPKGEALRRATTRWCADERKREREVRRYQADRIAMNQANRPRRNT